MDGLGTGADSPVLRTSAWAVVVRRAEAGRLGRQRWRFRRVGMRPSRDGSAVLALLLGLLLLEIAVAGLIYVCTQEALIARLFGERLRHRAAAESAIDAALGAWPADSLRLLPPGGRHLPAGAAGVLHGGARYDAGIERLHGGWFLVHGAGSAPAGPAAARAAALVSMFETGPFWLDFAAPVSSAGPVHVLGGTLLDATVADAIPPPWTAAACPALRMVDMLASLGTLHPAALALAFPTFAVVDPAADLRGAPAIAQDSGLISAPFDTVGPLPLSQVAVFADRVETGSITLSAAAQAGRCDESAPGNWGAPSNPSHACADYVPLVFAPGDLEVLGGEGQALLIVGGHLRLHAGARVVGAVFAQRGMTSNGAEVTGAVRLGADSSVLGGIFRYNACALWRAFTRPAPLRLPTRRGEHWWLPAF